MREKFLSEETRSKLLKIGILLLLAGIVLFVLGTPILMKPLIPQEYMMWVLSISFSLMPVGSALIMASKLMTRIEYLLGIICFLVFLGIFFSLKLNKLPISSQAKMNACCSLLVYRGGCSRIPESFRVDWNNDGTMENCTSLEPGDSLEKWKEACPCPG